MRTASNPAPALEQTPRRPCSFPVLFLGCLAALLILTILAIGVGRYAISPATVVRVLLSRFLPIPATWEGQAESVIFTLRLPRILAALLVGSALSLSGAAYQGVFKNPLVAPDMLGVSVVGMNNQTLNGDVLDVTEFFELYSCDLVGLPAATTSLFNNQNEKKMNKFFSSFASLFKKSSFATETVETVDGSSITIEAAGETMAIGDKVFDSEGNVHPDGNVEVQVEDGVLVIAIANGVIESVEAKVEEEKEEEEIEVETQATADVPEEFANRMAALETSVTELTATLEAMTAQFSRATAKPGVPPVNMPKKKETKLSKEAVAEAAKQFYNK